MTHSHPSKRRRTAFHQLRYILPHNCILVTIISFEILILILYQITLVPGQAQLLVQLFQRCRHFL